MLRPLLAKAIRDAQSMFLACAALLFAFPWIFVWLTSLMPRNPLEEMLRSLPPAMQNLFVLPIADVLTYRGRISLAYVDASVLFASAAWAVSRGSDVVAGELNRGTLEMLLGQPVRRLAILATQAAVAVGGAALLALSAWLGTWAGLATVDLGEPMDAAWYVPAAVNLFCLTVCVAGIATLFSACDRYRWRAVGLVSGLYVVQLVIKVMSRMAPSVEWMGWLSFHSAYLPQVLSNRPDEVWRLSLQYNGLLLGLGAAGYVLAAIVFCRRDLPAPL